MRTGPIVDDGEYQHRAEFVDPGEVACARCGVVLWQLAGYTDECTVVLCADCAAELAVRVAEDERGEGAR